MITKYKMWRSRRCTGMGSGFASSLRQAVHAGFAYLALHGARVALFRLQKVLELHTIRSFAKKKAKFCKILQKKLGVTTPRNFRSGSSNGCEVVRWSASFVVPKNCPMSALSADGRDLGLIRSRARSLRSQGRRARCSIFSRPFFFSRVAVAASFFRVFVQTSLRIEL